MRKNLTLSLALTAAGLLGAGVLTASADVAVDDTTASAPDAIAVDRAGDITAYAGGGGVKPNGVRTIFLERGPGAGSTPMNVGYHPGFNQYYSANGGSPSFAAFVYDAAGNRIQDFEPLNIDVRAWNYIPVAGRLEILSFDAQNGDGGNIRGLVAPGVNGAGLLTGGTTNIVAALPGLDGSQTMPAYDPNNDVFFSRDTGTPTVNVVRRPNGALVGVITLDLPAAGVGPGDLSAYCIGFDRRLGCLVVFDATNNRALVYETDGSFVGASQLDVNVEGSYRNAYANGQAFVFDTGRNGWQGFMIKNADDPCPCPEDIDRDGQVAFSDILRVLAAWGPCEEGCGEGGICDEYVLGCGGNDLCACVKLFDGSTTCQTDWSCTGISCPDGDCPPDFHCVVDSCCEEFTCVPDDTLCENGVHDVVIEPGAATGFSMGRPVSMGAVSDQPRALDVDRSDWMAGTGRYDPSTVVVRNAPPVGYSGGVTPIGPFVGDHTETWEGYVHYLEGGFHNEPSPISMMGGFGQAADATDALFIYDPDAATWGFCSSGLAQTSDGVRGMGQNSNAGTVVMSFAAPISSFGAYFGAGTCVNDPSTVSLTFRDADGNVVGNDSFQYSRSGQGADGLLEWHGWTAGSPVSSVSYSGEFVVTDGVQVDEADDECGPCPEDIDKDGQVAFSDILRILAAWGPCPGQCDNCDEGGVDRCGVEEICHECETPDGQCLCVLEGSCDPERQCDDGECPPGFYCCTNTCCGFDICLPECAVGVEAPEFEPGTRTSGGRVISP